MQVPGRGWRRFGGHNDVVVMGIRLRAWFVGCSSAGPCGFARVCPLCNCIMIVSILDIT